MSHEEEVFERVAQAAVTEFGSTLIEAGRERLLPAAAISAAVMLGMLNYVIHMLLALSSDRVNFLAGVAAAREDFLAGAASIYDAAARQATAPEASS